MILEVAVLNVKPGMENEFELAFNTASKIISQSSGYLNHSLQKCVEKNGQYLLLVNWTSIDAHQKGFRGSEPYQKWKRLLHHFYEPFPEVLHYMAVEGCPKGTL